MPHALAVSLIAISSLASRGAETLAPGQVDFGKFSASESAGQFVEVNLSGGLISLASRLVEKQEPEVAKLLNGLQSVHVTVIGLDTNNRGDLEKRAQHIRKDLDGKGWQCVVTAQKQQKDVSVFLKMRDKDAVQGLAVVAMDGKERAIFVNVVGDIRPEQLSLLGEKLHIDPLKKLGRARKDASDDR
jgi:hypothetical protein